MSTVEQTVASLKGIPTREQLMETLKKEVAVVTFKKLNGDERKMPCTLITDFLLLLKKMMQLRKRKCVRYQTRFVQYGQLNQKAFVVLDTTV